MKYIARIFINGILVVLPLILTLFIVYWFFSLFETTFKRFVLLFAPDLYFPGLGTLLGIGIIFVAGILMQNWGMVKLYKYGEHLIEKFPLLGDIYSSLKSLLQYFTTPGTESVEQVVVIEYEGIKTLGIVTRDNFKGCPEGLGGEDVIAVYLPMSYGIGGYTIYLNKKYVTPIQMTKKAALQWILTAGLTANKSADVKPVEIKK